MASLAQAQDPPAAGPAITLRFESWHPASPADSSTTMLLARVGTAARDRGDQALLGGVIGAAVGVVSCTFISTMLDDSADGGLSFCPLDTFVLFTAGGFAAGALIGWLI